MGGLFLDDNKIKAIGFDNFPINDYKQGVLYLDPSRAVSSGSGTSSTNSVLDKTATYDFVPGNGKPTIYFKYYESYNNIQGEWRYSTNEKASWPSGWSVPSQSFLDNLGIGAFPTKDFEAGVAFLADIISED